ncbi:Sodium/glucose cotransporter [Maioricimonas rarisocia]|uniref:Sodium/glucose cotransporter n=1 Tax=Maioricimonas rarisocia TaxID=2528026 RepID=A0A517Z8P5_9PLAN|nr:sodium:solute symporter family protein [Maioricimonas rarisocia]QDU38836.1 Sodium/glucose cotransporter [Maioricimonas rarisocia]
MTLIATQDASGFWLGLHWLDWTVLCVYLIGITGIGLWSYRKVHDMTDFFMGGRRFGKVFMMFFAFGAGTSSEQAVSVAAGSFRNGLAGIWYQFLWLWATPFYWIIAPVFRRMRALTTSDFFEARYDSSTALLYSMLGILMSITFISAALFGGAEMVSGLSGGQFPKSYAIAGMTIMFVLYGMAGGLGAAVITDFVQGILTIIFSFLLLPFALNLAASITGAESGFAALQQGVPGRSGAELLSMTLSPEVAARLLQEPITVFYVVMLSMTGLVGIVVQPHIMGVCGAGRTEFEGRFGFTAGNFMKRLCTIAWTFTGLACIIVYMTPDNGMIPNEQAQLLRNDPAELASFADQVFGRAAHDILPTIGHGLVGLLFASLLAAIMSTCDAQMVVGSGLFTENVYKRYLKPQGSARHYLWIGRFAGLAIVILALLLMSQFENVIQVLTRYVQPIPAFMGMAFWLGITWRGYTPKGVWASVVTTFMLWYLTTSHKPIATIAAMGDSALLQQNIDFLPALFRDWLWGVLPASKAEILNSAGEVAKVQTSLPWQIVLYLGGGTVAGIVTSLLTRRTPEEKLDHFFRLIRTPVHPDEEIKRPCTLPENPLPAETGKLIPLKDLEIPWPSLVGISGFLFSWLCVAGIIWLTYALASLGKPPL